MDGPLGNEQHDDNGGINISCCFPMPNNKTVLVGKKFVKVEKNSKIQIIRSISDNSENNH